VLQGTESLQRNAIRRLAWHELEHVLPDRGLPIGVVEIALPFGASRGAMCGGATTIALSAVSAAHAESAGTWCAWINPEGAPLLHAPAAAQANVDLERLLVVRTPAISLARTAVKCAASGAFAIVVVDALAGLEGRLGLRDRKMDGSVVVRKLALAAEEQGTTTILLTSMFTSRAMPWPVALRLEVERRPDAISVRVAKDRRGSASSSHVVRIAS
jgi:RecA/RadA recombinase